LQSIGWREFLFRRLLGIDTYPADRFRYVQMLKRTE